MVRTDDPRIEVIARAICRRCGYEADAPVIYGGGQDVRHGPFGSVLVTGSSRPAWTLYGDLAVSILKSLTERGGNVG